MKVHRDSGQDHWIYGKLVTCGMCGTEFEAETSIDFQRGADETYVIMVCPRKTCGKANRIYKSAWRTAAENQTEVTWDEKSFDTSFDDLFKKAEKFLEVGDKVLHHPWTSTIIEQTVTSKKRRPAKGTDNIEKRQ